MRLSRFDAYYLRSIMRQLKELHEYHVAAVPQPSLPGEALADNIEWLDTFIANGTRHQPKQGATK